MKEEIQRLREKKKKVIKNLPSISEVIRGTLIPWYGVCKNQRCPCHKDKKYLHGPYYRVSYSKGGRTHHIYVSVKDKETIRGKIKNYERIWDAIEEISGLNIRMMRAKR